MVVKRCKQNRTPIEKSGQNCIENRIGLTRSRRALYIRQRIFHGVVDCQKLVEVDALVEQSGRIVFTPYRAL